MNFFDVSLEDDRLVGSGFEYPLSSPIRSELAGDEKLVLGIRPEDIEVLDARETAHDFPVRVDVVEPMGNENNLLAGFRTDENDSQFNVTTDGMRRIEGTHYIARFPESAIHVFDRESGVALHSREIDDEATLLESRI